ncbi:hypothetical protein LC609_16390 [Nostoc sp. XA013]|nr:hypothetical protein [Nostoc sp. XA013]
MVQPGFDQNIFSRRIIAAASITATVAYPAIANIIKMKGLLAKEIERRCQAANATVAEMITVTLRITK